jgi:hypothetical protein
MQSTDNATANRHLAHRDDPQSSKAAAANLNLTKNARVKAALLDLLREQSGAPFEVQALYGLLRDVKGWPAVQPHSVNRRLSELKKAGHVVGTGQLVRTPDGATAERLALAEEVAS